jgi:hypothetical protein
MESYKINPDAYNINTDELWKINSEPVDKEFSNPNTMIEKIKKIKTKNQKKKKLNNYKNIELFENIHDIEHENNSEKILEGLTDGIARFRDDDYDGIKDNIYEGDAKTTSKSSNSLADIINKFFDQIHNFTYYIALNITKSFSSKKDYNHNDVYVVQKYVGWFFSILISCYVIYNWVFIMFYKDEIGKSVELPVFLDREHFDTMSYTNIIYRLADYFVHFSLFFPEMLQKSINFISEYVPIVLNISVCFALLFFFIIFCSYHSLEYIKDFFLSIITLNYKNPILMIMYFTIIFLLLLYQFEYDVNPINVISKLNPVIYMVTTVINILRYIFIVFCGVPIAAVFCIFYICIYSFFGIILLNGFNFKEFSKIFSKINKYCNETKPKMRKETPCEPYSLFERIMSFINNGFDFIYTYVFQISFMYLFLYGIIEYLVMNSLKSNTLKMTLSIINFVLLFTLTTNCYSDFISKDNSGDNNSDNNGNVNETNNKNSLDKDVVEKSTLDKISTIPGIPGSLSDISKMSGLPEMPKIPGIPGNLSDISKMSGLPEIPKIPEMPKDLSDISKMSGLPEIPKIPEMPKDLSDISKLSGLPEIPKIPEIPKDLSDISKMSGLPEIPKIPEIPKNLSDISKLI